VRRIRLLALTGTCALGSDVHEGEEIELSSKAWRVAAALAASAVLALAAGCGGDDEPEGGGNAASGGSDTGETITMWTRAATQTQSERLVKAYNESHENQVELTVIPTDNYQARIAAAAGGKNLPDVFASDVIYAPNYTSQGLYLDITDRIDALEFADALAPAHMRLGTYEDAKYTVPHTLDLSVLFWNKDLYKKAGLDPETPSTTMKEFAEHAKTIREKVGGKTYGTFFGGNCPGCFVFTFWPSVWAAGGDIMNEDGTESTIDDPNMAATFAPAGQGPTPRRRHPRLRSRRTRPDRLLPRIHRPGHRRVPFRGLRRRLERPVRPRRRRHPRRRHPRPRPRPPLRRPAHRPHLHPVPRVGQPRAVYDARLGARALSETMLA
jgi:Bacterial extracellular solute-binding protein